LTLARHLLSTLFPTRRSSDLASGTKIDYFATRRVSYDVTLGGDGQAVATTRVRLSNGAPTHGQPPYVIGPRASAARAGDQVSLRSEEHTSELQSRGHLVCRLL